jgi:phage shock protein C
MNNEIKKLYRSEKDSLVAGIIGGIGEYFNVDPTILRLAFIVLVLITGIFPGVIVYIIAYFIIPDRPAGSSWQKEKKEEPIVTPAPAPKTNTEPTPEPEVKTDIEKTTDETEETLSQLKKPNWPVINPEKEEIEYPEDIEPETPTLDSLMDEDYERAADLDDIIDE